MNTSNVADWSMDFCAYNAVPATMNGWLRSAAPTVGALGERRGFCPSCGARRMAESAAMLVDEVLPHEPIRQWVLSFPFQLRFLFASRPELMGKVLGIVNRAIVSRLIKKAGLTHKTAKTGAVTLIQRFGRSGAPGALNLNPNAARPIFICYFWMAYTQKKGGGTKFHRTNAPDQQELTKLVHTISHRVARFLERQGILERDE